MERPCENAGPIESCYDLGSKALKDHIDALRCGLDADGAWNGSRCFELLGVGHDPASGQPLPFQLARSLPADRVSSLS